MATRKQSEKIVEGAEGGGNSNTGFKFKRVKLVTVPVLRLLPEEPVYIRITSPMEVSKQTAAKMGDKPMEPATVVNVIDLTTGAEAIVILGTALKGIINDTYPGDSYVGLDFEVVNHGKRADKGYNTYTVTEVEVE